MRRLQRKTREEIPQTEFLVDPPGDKMSEVLMAFVEPYLGAIDTDEEMHRLISLAIAAWNLSSLPEQDRDADIKEMQSGLSRSQKRDLRGAIDHLVARKEKHFSQYDRLIVRYELVESGEGYYLAVASTLPELPE